MVQSSFIGPGSDAGIDLAPLIRARGPVVHRQPACLGCGGSAWVRLSAATRERDDVGVLGCASCGFARLDPLPTPSPEYYQHEYREERGRGTDPGAIRARPVKIADTERRLDALAALAGENGRVLDIGCGSGALLHGARERGRTAMAGVEPDRRFRDALRADGFDVRADVAEHDGERFDAVTVFHVLEHVHEPEAFLHDAARRLRRTGALVIEVPCLLDPLLWIFEAPAYWRFYWQLAHLWYFTPAALRSTVRRAGLDVAELTLVQRYGLANHLRWLNGAASDERFQPLAPPDVDRPYRDALRRSGVADTLWAVCRPTQP